MRIAGIVFTLLLWLIFGYKLYSDSQSCCSNSKISPAPAISEISKADACPICFQYNNGEPKFCNNWNRAKSNIIKSCDDDDNIIIDIYTDKVEGDSITNVRTERLKALFEGAFDMERIICRSVSKKWNPKDKSSCVARASIRKSAVSSINENVVRLDDRIAIYFPSNSSDRINNQNVESYLNSIASELRRNSKKIKLVGHTDNVDTPEHNLTLGQERADVIKTYLISKGISATRIIAVSKGEALPIASNVTSAGQAKNRRVELQIIE